MSFHSNNKLVFLKVSPNWSPHDVHTCDQNLSLRRQTSFIKFNTSFFQQLVLLKRKSHSCSVNMSYWSNSYKQYFTHNEMPVLLYCFSWLITLDLWTYFWSYLDLGRIFKHALCSQDHVKGTIRKKAPQQNVFLGFSAHVSMFWVPEWYSDYWKLSLPLYLRAHRLQVWGGRKRLILILFLSHITFGDAAFNNLYLLKPFSFPGTDLIYTIKNRIMSRRTDKHTSSCTLT